MSERSPSAEGNTRVVVAEDHHVVRHALRRYLERSHQMIVVDEVAEGSTLREVIERHRPDVLLMDAEMPHHHPIEATEQLRAAFPEMKIIVLSAHKSPDYVVGLFKAGVHGYVLKDDPADALTEAINQVMQGEQWISPQAATVLARFVRDNGQNQAAPLTGREQEVLLLMARGLRNEDIADALTISEHTARNHIASIFKKLGVETRVEAVVYALTSGLVSLDEIESHRGQESGPASDPED